VHKKPGGQTDILCVPKVLATVASSDCGVQMYVMKAEDFHLPGGEDGIPLQK